MSAPEYKSYEQSLLEFENIAAAIPPISAEELNARIAKLQGLMRAQGVKAVYLDTSTSLTYFTAITLGASERLHGAIIPSSGSGRVRSQTISKPGFRTPTTGASTPSSGVTAR